MVSSISQLGQLRKLLHPKGRFLSMIKEQLEPPEPLSIWGSLGNLVHGMTRSMATRCLGKNAAEVFPRAWTTPLKFGAFLKA